VVVEQLLNQVLVVVAVLLEHQVKFNLAPVAAHLMAIQHLHGTAQH
jgi:hypothetical protein